jgi:hypothetical protein
MLFRTRSFELISSLSPDECVRRLKAAVDSPGWSLSVNGIPVLSREPKTPVVGSVGEAKFRICGAAISRNGFQEWLFGRFSKEGDGTRLQCQYKLHPFGIIFMAFWFGAVLIFGSAPLRSGKEPTLVLDFWVHREYHGGWAYLGLPLMLVGGIATVALCRWYARDEIQFLKDFLRATLVAHEISAK